MKYAIISDVHANPTALERVLEDSARYGVEKVICAGDVVGYGPDPASRTTRAMSFTIRRVGTSFSGALRSTSLDTPRRFERSRFPFLVGYGRQLFIKKALLLGAA